MVYRYGTPRKLKGNVYRGEIEQKKQQQQPKGILNLPNIPGWVTFNHVKDDTMQNLFWLPILVLTLMGVVLGLIIANAIMDPGFLDPDTKGIRFVSDGFKVSTRTYHSMYEWKGRM